MSEGVAVAVEVGVGLGVPVGVTVTHGVALGVAVLSCIASPSPFAAEAIPIEANAMPTIDKMEINLYLMISSPGVYSLNRRKAGKDTAQDRLESDVMAMLGLTH
jgi:hypothetical protein